LNIVEKSPFCTSEVWQEFVGDVGRFIFSGVAILQDVVYQNLVKIRWFFSEIIKKVTLRGRFLRQDVYQKVGYAYSLRR